MLSFCIVVPMYNEEGNAEKCVKTLCNFLASIEYKTSLIVVNDGSTDKTGEILNGINPQYSNLFVEEHTKNQGYGAANITGAKRAFKEGFKYVLFMDADLTQDPKYIFSFIELMKEDIDFIKATRYSQGGGTKGVPFKRWIVSKVGNSIAKTFLPLPISDYTNGFRAVKSELLSQISAEERGFAYLIEEVKKMSKLAKTFAEVPYILTVREDTFSESKFSYSLIVYWKYLKWVLKR